MKQKDTKKVEKHCKEIVQVKKTRAGWKANFLKMMNKCESRWDRHQRKVTVAIKRTALNPPNAAPIKFIPYRVGSR